MTRLGGVSPPPVMDCEPACGCLAPAVRVTALKLHLSAVTRTGDSTAAAARAEVRDAYTRPA
ncbi:MAG TPA: hypothetical protein VMF50_11430, partial [Candidatus Binataceae bacterium]|nr:hypothetical protein [Candidatus Binataceae bacterium]